MNICTPQTAKAEKKKFFLQESRTKASPRNKLRAVCPKEKGAHRAPSMLPRAYQDKKEEESTENRKGRSESEKNENPPTQMLRVKKEQRKENRKTGRREEVKKVGRQGAKVGEGEKIKDSNIEARQPNPKTPL